MGLLPPARHGAGHCGCISDSGSHHQGPRAAEPTVWVTEHLLVGTEEVGQLHTALKVWSSRCGCAPCLFLKRGTVFIQPRPFKSESQFSGMLAGFRALVRSFPCPLPLFTVRKWPRCPGLWKGGRSEKALREEDGCSWFEF